MTLIKTQPNPCREVPQYTTKLGNVSTEDVVNLLFNSWKHFSYASVHLNSFSLLSQGCHRPSNLGKSFEKFSIVAG